jgi:PAS domain S-box-containing protein
MAKIRAPRWPQSAIAALAGAAAFPASAGPVLSSEAMAAWAVVVLLGAIAIVLAVRRAALHRQLVEVSARFHTAGLQAPTASFEKDPIDRIARSLSSYREALEYASSGLSEEAARRAAAQLNLRELEERYRLAVRCADDAVWEWDLRADRAHFSARWKSLLGYAEHELTDRIDEWLQRVHPEDSERVLCELRAHLENRSTRFESEHRLQHRDGGWRWAHARAAAVRDGFGEPARMVGLVTDISPRKQVEEALLAIAEGLSALSGEECLRTLVHSFAEVLRVREAFVCECSNYPTTRVRMLARWKAGEFARCVEFDLTGTACEEVIRDGHTVFTPRDAGERWPMEKQYERDSYLGIPCLDSSGRVIGHIACADDRPMHDELPHQAILKIFAMRAAIEMERAQLDRERLIACGSHNGNGLEQQL